MHRRFGCGCYLVMLTIGVHLVLDRSLSSSSWPLDVRQVFLPSPVDFGQAPTLESPYILDHRRALVFKAILQHNAQWQLAFTDLLSSATPIEELSLASSSSTSVATSRVARPLALPAWLLRRMSGDTSSEQQHSKTAARCYAVAQFYGDESEIQFWALAIDAFTKAKNGGHPRTTHPASTLTMTSVLATASSNSASLASSGASPTGTPPTFTFAGSDTQHSPPPAAPTLTTTAAATTNYEPPEALGDTAVPKAPFLDLLMESETVRHAESMRAVLYDTQSHSYEQTHKSTHLHLLLGRKERAIELLFQTPHTDSRFYQDALKACVIAAAHSKSAFENAISHIASHLISQGNLDEVLARDIRCYHLGSNANMLLRRGRRRLRRWWCDVHTGY
jgi:hypothetical protein